MRHRDQTARSIARTATGVLLMSALPLCAAWMLACGSSESPGPAPEETPAAETAAAPTPPPPPPAASETPPPPRKEFSVPEGYPSDVPLYPDATPGPSMNMPGLGLFTTFESGDAVDDVLKHFRTELSDGGWNVEEVPDEGLSAEKDGRTVQVRARASEGGGTAIAVTIKENQG